MTASQTINIIVAATKENGIGLRGTLPFRIRKDMSFFATVTTLFGRGRKVYPSISIENSLEESGNLDQLNCCIMGRKTWDSIPQKFRPLKDRINIVLSRKYNGEQGARNAEGAIYFQNIENALTWCKSQSIPTIWIIGGAEIYNLAAKYSQSIFVTRVSIAKNDQLEDNRDSTVIECDTYLEFISADHLLNAGYRKQDEESFKSILGQEAPTGTHCENGFSFQFEIWEKSEKL